MRVIVTGASGFLGRAVMQNLAASGHDVLGLSRRNLPGLQQVASCADAPSGDALVHLAEASDRASVNARGQAAEQEAADTIHALLAKNYFRFVYASSAVLYGDAHNWPRRTDEAVNIVDSYTRIKYTCEQAVLGAGGAVARLANLYGPGMSPGNVVSTLLAQLEGNGPITLQDTTPVRDFLWIDDAAEAISSMVQHNEKGIFNIGTSVGTSIQLLAETALGIAGKSERPIHSLKANTPSSTLSVDISATQKTFGWQPKTSVAEGLKRLIGSAHG